MLAEGTKMRRLIVYLLICIMGAVFAACTKSSSTQNGADRVSDGESLSEPQTTETETSKEQSTETEAPRETETQTETQGETEFSVDDTGKYKLNTVESLEDDGKEMSPAEAYRSVMKGKHSVLELFEGEKFFWVNIDPKEVSSFTLVAESIEDRPDTGLARVDMLHYNRSGLAGAICPFYVTWGSFVCVDLDGDGKEEVLVSGEGSDVTVILHFVGDEVYMTSIYSKFRPAYIYENGVWETLMGAFDRQFYKIYPRKGATYHEQLAYEWVAEGMNPDSYIYKVKGKDVTKEEHDAYVEELIGGLTPLEWHEFTEENIDRYVVD